MRSPSISQISLNICIAWGFCRKAGSVSVGLESGPRVPVSNKLPGNAEAAESLPHSVVAVAVSVLQLDGGGGFRRDSSAQQPRAVRASASQLSPGPGRFQSPVAFSVLASP